MTDDDVTVISLDLSDFGDRPVVLFPAAIEAMVCYFGPDRMNGVSVWGHGEEGNAYSVDVMMTDDPDRPPVALCIALCREKADAGSIARRVVAAYEDAGLVSSYELPPDL